MNASSASERIDYLISILAAVFAVAYDESHCSNVVCSFLEKKFTEIQAIHDDLKAEMKNEHEKAGESGIDCSPQKSSTPKKEENADGIVWFSYLYDYSFPSKREEFVQHLLAVVKFWAKSVLPINSRDNTIGLKCSETYNLKLSFRERLS